MARGAYAVSAVTLGYALTWHTVEIRTVSAGNTLAIEARDLGWLYEAMTCGVCDNQVYASRPRRTRRVRCRLGLSAGPGGDPAAAIRLRPELPAVFTAPLPRPPGQQGQLPIASRQPPYVLRPRARHNARRPSG